MNKLVVTMRDIQKYKVLTEVIEKKLTAIEASELLSLSYRHTIRLKDKVKTEGFEGLLRRTPLHPPNKKITDEVVDEILGLRRQTYYDFNIAHFKDKLEENHHVRLCYETLRQILIKHKEHSPRKKKIIHRQRRRMPKAGMLIQMDSSQHQWLEHIPEKWWLVAMIDDATNEVPYARFFQKDTLFANMHVIRRFIEIKGLFISLYADKASHFKTTRHGGLHYTINQEQEDTQIERALEELGITIIPAHSPQAKGRIEVTFRLFQDRLIKEMRLAGIKTYDEANQFLIEKFLPWYNNKYTHDAESAYMPLPKEKNLDLIFCIKKERTVNGDNTVGFDGQIIQIPPSNIKLSFAKTKVNVCLLEDRRVFVVYKGKIIVESILSEDDKILKKEKKIENLLNKREYIKTPSVKNISPKAAYIPPANHPWRKNIANEIKLKQIRKSR
ncbi:MAG: ISNCY family transposase, partial [Nitrospirota bacterium]